MGVLVKTVAQVITCRRSNETIVSPHYTEIEISTGDTTWLTNGEIILACQSLVTLILNFKLSGIVRSGTLMNISPSGIQIECQHNLIEQLSRAKSDSGLFPNFELEFELAAAGRERVKSVCNVSYCRRLSQDNYNLGLNFIALSDSDERRVTEFINKMAA